MFSANTTARPLEGRLESTNSLEEMKHTYRDASQCGSGGALFDWMSVSGTQQIEERNHTWSRVVSDESAVHG